MKRKYTEDHRKLLKVATLYYNQGLTQAQIAKKMKISRPVISKMLQAARDLGIITIFIKDEDAECVDLGVQLEQRYGLEDVLVIASGEHTLEQTRRDVSRAAAMYLVEQLQTTTKIGLSWGTTLSDMIDEMPYLSYPNITVCPLVGGVSNEHLFFDTNHLAFQLAEKLHSGCQYLYAPALAESKELADSLNHSQMVQRALSDAKQVDIAIVGVGNPRSSSTWRRLGYLSENEVERIKETGVVGDAVASLFDKQGKTINNEISERMLGIKVEDLNQIPKVMVIGCGIDKTSSIRPLLVGKRCSVLVIDQQIAKQLLQEGVD